MLAALIIRMAHPTFYPHLPRPRSRLQRLQSVTALDQSQMQWAPVTASRELAKEEDARKGAALTEGQVGMHTTRQRDGCK